LSAGTEGRERVGKRGNERERRDLWEPSEFGPSDSSLETANGQ